MRCRRCGDELSFADETRYTDSPTDDIICQECEDMLDAMYNRELIDDED